MYCDFQIPYLQLPMEFRPQEYARSIRASLDGLSFSELFRLKALAWQRLFIKPASGFLPVGFLEDVLESPQRLGDLRFRHDQGWDPADGVIPGTTCQEH